MFIVFVETSIRVGGEDLGICTTGRASQVSYIGVERSNVHLP